MENNDLLKKFLENFNIEEILDYKEFVINDIKMNNEILKTIEEILEERGL